MKTLRASLAAAAIALIGLVGAGSAAAKPLLPTLPVKFFPKLCHPHYETKVQYLGIKKIGFKYSRVYRVTKIYVNRFCFNYVVSVKYLYVPLPWFHNSKPAV